MACKAVDALVRALNQAGPDILQAPVFDHYANGKAVMGKRLQDKGQGPPGDVHNTGRALDICVYAMAPVQFKAPSPERPTGYGLVNIFIELQPEMGWQTMIYDSKEWTNGGSPVPRVKTTYTSEMDRVKHEHLTHIHIDWPLNRADNDAFFEDLVDMLNGGDWSV